MGLNLNSCSEFRSWPEALKAPEAPPSPGWAGCALGSWAGAPGVTLPCRDRSKWKSSAANSSTHQAPSSLSALRGLPVFYLLLSSPKCHLFFFFFSPQRARRGKLLMSQPPEKLGDVLRTRSFLLRAGISSTALRSSAIPN